MRPRRGSTVPHYDTGAWSLYDQSTESDLGYHELLDGFLRNLCTRVQDPAPTIAASIPRAGSRPTRSLGPIPTTGGSPAPAGGPPTTPTTPATPKTPATPATPATPKTPKTPKTPATPATPTTPTPPTTPTTPATNVFCTTAAAFAADLHKPPKVALGIAGRPRAGRPTDVSVTLSKVSNVAMTAVRRGRVTAAIDAQLPRGTAGLRWTPTAAGRYAITVRATDLAGNAAQTSLVVSVTAARPARPRHR